MSGIMETGRANLLEQEALLDELMMQWPTGQYALPAAGTGCPVPTGA